MKNRMIQFSVFFTVWLIVGLLMGGSAPAQAANEAYWADAATDTRINKLSFLVDEEKVVRVKAEVPDGKTLKAYNLSLTYEAAKISVVSAVASPGSTFAPANINTATAGTIVFNAFNVSGVAGPTTISFVDVTVKGLAVGCFNFVITVNSFGAGASDQFKPTPENLEVCVSGVPAKLAFTSQPLSQDAGAKGTMNVELQDKDGNAASAPADVAVSLASTSATHSFYNAAGDTVITSVTIPEGSSAATFQYYDEALGTPDVTASATGYTAAVQQQSITVGGVANLTIVSGDGQTGTVGEALGKAFVVEATDQFGNKVSGLTITFAVEAGGGTLSNTAPQTNANGRAQAILTLGNTAGIDNNEVSASGDGIGPVTFMASATAGPAASVAVVSGDTQTGIVGAALADPFIVEVKDQYDNGVPNVDVTFAITAGGGNLSQDQQATDADGRAQTVLTLGTVAGADNQTVTASVDGVAPAEFTASSTAAAFSKFLVAIATQVTAGAAGDLTVTIRDQFNNTVTDFSGTVKITSTDPKAELPADYAFAAGDNGVHTFTGGVTLKTAGNQKVTVASDSVSNDKQVTVNAADAAKVTLAASKTTLASDQKGSATLTASLFDAFDNAVTTDGITVNLTPSDATYVSLDNAAPTTTKGVATATITTKAGPVANPPQTTDVKASSTGLTDSDPVQFTLVNFSIDVANSQTNLVRSPLTPNSVALTGQGGSAGNYRWTLTGVGSFSSTAAVTASSEDTVTFYAPNAVTGDSQTATVSVTDANDQSLGDQVILTVFNPTKLVFTNAALSQAAGVSGTMTVEVQAESGNPVTAGEFMVKLASDSAGTFHFYTTGTTTPITEVAIPDGSSSASFDYNDEKVGTPTVTGSEDNLIAANQQQAIVPAAAAKMTLVASKTVLASDGKGSATLTATLLDPFSNIVATDDATVVNFALTDPTYVTLSSNTATVSKGVAEVTVTTKAGTVQNPPATSGVDITSGTLTPPDTDPDVALTIVNFSIDVAGGQTALMTKGNTPDSVVLTGLGGTSGNYRWTIAGVGSFSATSVVTTSSEDSVTFYAPDTITGTSQVGTVTVTDANDQNLTDAVNLTVFQTLGIEDKPTEPVTVNAGETSQIFSVAGGDGPYTWSVVGPVAVAGAEGAEYQFVAPETGAFAGTYTVNVTDGNDFTDSFEVMVPLKFTPQTMNILAGESFDLILAGADPGAQVSEIKFLDSQSNEIAAADMAGYATLNPAAPLVFDANSEAKTTVTGAAVQEVKTFKIEATTDDPDLVAENLNVAETGLFRVLPAVTYEGVVQDAGTQAPIGNAEVAFVLGNEIQAQVQTGADGMFSVNLADPAATNAEYNVVFSAANYITRTDITTVGWQNPETIDLTAATAGISGQVLKTDGVTPIAGAVVEATVDDQPLVAYTDANGNYTLNLPVALQDLTEVMARASALGYQALTQDILLTPDFELEGQTAFPTQVCQDGGYLENAPCTVNFPTDALDACYDVDINLVGVGEENMYTEKSVVLVEIDLSAGGTLQGPIQVTIPFDTNEVGPGDFKAGRAVVYHAPNTADLQAGINVAAVATGDILAQDDLNGLVTFNVTSLSTFSAGSPAQAAAGGDGGGSGGCFIRSTSMGGSALVILTIFLTMGLGISTYALARRKVR